MPTADRRKLQAYLDRPLDDLMGELELYTPASRSPADRWISSIDDETKQSNV